MTIRLIKKWFLVVLFLISFVSMNAQEKQNNIRVGFGVCVSSLSEIIFTNGIPTFLIPINIGSSIKIEPQIAYYKSENEKWDEEETQTSIGLGAFLKRNTNNVSIYYGAVFGITDYKLVDNYSGTKETTKEKGLFIEPTMGGEYNILDNFSVGGEFGVGILNKKISESDENEKYENKYISTKTKIIFRFYF